MNARWLLVALVLLTVVAVPLSVPDIGFGAVATAPGGGGGGSTDSGTTTDDSTSDDGIDSYGGDRSFEITPSDRHSTEPFNSISDLMNKYRYGIPIAGWLIFGAVLIGVTYVLSQVGVVLGPLSIFGYFPGIIGVEVIIWALFPVMVQGVLGVVFVFITGATLFSVYNSTIPVAD